MTAVPSVRGQMGNIKYYQCTMSAKDLVARTQNATDYFSEIDWEEMGVAGKMQRDINPRYLSLIAPYLLRTKDRFFNSIVVLLDEKLCKFVSLDDYSLNVGGKVKKASDFVPFDRQDEAKRVGFLEIKDKGEMLILDGQHRMRAIRAIVSPNDTEKNKLKKILEKNDEADLAKSDNGVMKDLLSVVFVTLRDRTAQRKLFGDINSYANPISQKERIMISEDNGYYKIVQNIAKEDDIIPEKWVYFKSTSLPDRAAAITTGKHLAEIVQKVCDTHGYGKWPKQKMPPEEELDKAEKLVKTFLTEFFSKIDAYKDALSNDPSEISDKRDKTHVKKWGLLFKPMPQVALADTILYLKEESDLDTNAIYRQINKIDWSWGSGSQFEGMVLTTDGTILTGSKIQKRLTSMIICWVLGKSKFVSTVGEDAFNKLTKDWRTTTNRKGDFPEVIYK
jgi:DNA sulfur modification protein DndB